MIAHSILYCGIRCEDGIGFQPDFNRRVTRSHVYSSIASIIPFFFSGQETEKEALHKSALTSEVAVAPTFGLVIPVYCRQTGFSSASINFYEKPMVETEPTKKYRPGVSP